MKIAFISYEYPPDTAFGGIATYVRHAALMLARGGHHVEVVCGSRTRTETALEDGVHVHRIHTGTRGAEFFGPVAAQTLAVRHRTIGGFDVVESPDANAEAAEFAAHHPTVALVVKLHTPLYLVHRLSAAKFGPREKLRFILGGLRRGQWPRLPQVDRRPFAFERTHALAADRIAAPCTSIAQIVGREWGLPADRISHFHYPFVCADYHLAVPPPESGPGRRILFIGRLEARKGVQIMGRTLDLVRRQHPQAVLRCVGRIMDSPQLGLPMDAYLRQTAGASAAAIEFVPPMPNADLAREFAWADVCVFPSLWENFPYACMEAMAAARAIVASSSGGMAEMLAGDTGLLAPPGRPRVWAEAISRLLAPGALRFTLGARARARVMQEYAYERILPQQLAGYEAAIAQRQAGGERPVAALLARPAPGHA